MKIIKSTIFSIIPLIVLICISEVTLNIYSYSRDLDNPHLGFPFNVFRKYFKEDDLGNNTKNYRIPWDYNTNKMRPGNYITEKGINYHINKKGFRGKEPNLIKMSGPRIVCLGGSSTLGLESPDDKTYPAILESNLQSKGKKAEVLNYGFSSKSLNYIYNIIVNDVINYNPDIITIFSNRNTSLYDSPQNSNFYSDIIYERKNNYLRNTAYILYQNSMIFRGAIRLKNIINSSLNENVSNNEYFTVNSVKYEKKYFFHTYVKIIEDLELFLSDRDVKLVLIKQPLYIDPKLQNNIKNLSIDELWDLLYDQANYNFSKHTELDKFFIITNAILNKQITNIEYKNKSIIVIDPIEKFLGQNISHDELFHDYVHLTVKGNSVLANAILDKIINIL